jgi:hypothetical protein
MEKDVGSDKGQSCRVVGFALDQLPFAGFRGFRLGRFLSKPKPVCETMGSCFVEGDTGIDVGLGSRLSSDPRFALSPEVVVSLSSTVMALSSSASGILEVL